MQMEIKSLVFTLKYGPVEFLLGTIPHGLTAFLNIMIIEAGFRQI